MRASCSAVVISGSAYTSAVVGTLASWRAREGRVGGGVSKMERAPDVDIAGEKWGSPRGAASGDARGGREEPRAPGADDEPQPEPERGDTDPRRPAAPPEPPAPVPPAPEPPVPAPPAPIVVGRPCLGSHGPAGVV